MEDDQSNSIGGNCTCRNMTDSDDSSSDESSHLPSPLGSSITVKYKASTCMTVFKSSTSVSGLSSLSACRQQESPEGTVGQTGALAVLRKVMSASRHLAFQSN